MKAGLATSLSIVGVLATGGAALVLNSSILDTESSAKGSPAFATVVGLEAQGGVTPLGDGATPGSVAELSANGVADLIAGNNPPLANPVVVAPRVSAAAAAPAAPSKGSSSGSSSSASGATGAANGGIKQSQANLTATETTDVASPTTVAPAPAPTTTAPVPAPTTTVAPNVEKQFKVGDAATITLVINGTKLLVKDIAITPGSGYKVTNQMSRDGDDVRITLASPTRVLEFSARLVNGQIMAAVSAPSSGNLTPPPPRRHHDDDDDDDHEEREHDDDHEEREHDGEREHNDDD